MPMADAAYIRSPARVSRHKVAASRRDGGLSRSVMLAFGFLLGVVAFQIAGLRVRACARGEACAGCAGESKRGDRLVGGVRGWVGAWRVWAGALTAVCAVCIRGGCVAVHVSVMQPVSKPQAQIKLESKLSSSVDEFMTFQRQVFKPPGQGPGGAGGAGGVGDNALVLCRRWSLAYHVRGPSEEALKLMPEHVRQQWHSNDCWSLVKVCRGG